MKSRQVAAGRAVNIRPRVSGHVHRLAFRDGDFARTQTVYDGRAVSREECEAALATRVTAPIAGRLSDRRVVVAGYVKAGDTVLTSVGSMDPIHCRFTGSEAAYLKCSRANQAGTRRSSRRRSLPR